MSFPLSTLPYGLLRRLHEGATEYERLQLVKASSNALPCPRPFQRRYHQCKGATFMLHYGKLVLKNEIPDMVNIDHVVTKTKSSTAFHNLSVKHLISEDRIKWSKFMLKSRKLEFKRCELSKEFLKKVAALHMKRSSISVLSIQAHSDLVIDFEHLFELAPNTSDLIINGRWAKSTLNDIREHQKSKLRYLSLNSDFDFENKFEFHELREFIMSQHNEFTLEFRTRGSPTSDWLVTMLNNEQLPRFQEGASEPKATILVHNYYGESRTFYIY